MRLVRLKDQLVERIYKLVLYLHLPVELLELSLCLHGVSSLVFQVRLDGSSFLPRLFCFLLVGRHLLLLRLKILLHLLHLLAEGNVFLHELADLLFRILVLRGRIVTSRSMVSARWNLFTAISELYLLSWRRRLQQRLILNSCLLFLRRFLAVIRFWCLHARICLKRGKFVAEVQLFLQLQ